MKLSAMMNAALCLALASGFSACSDKKTSAPVAPPASAPVPATPVAPPVAVAPAPAAKPETPAAPTGIEGALLASHAPRNAIEKARNATLFVDSGFGSGSGFFINRNCVIMTNKHVVEMKYDEMKKQNLRLKEIELYLQKGVADADERSRLYEEKSALEKAVAAYLPSGRSKQIIVSLIDGEEFAAKEILASEKYDLAYLYIHEDNCPYLEPLLDNDLPVGQRVYTIGNPRGMKYSVTSGIISGYQEDEKTNFIQTDAPLNPGNSGGPLIDEQGRFLGVNSWIITNSEGLGYALPAPTAMEDYKKNAADIDKVLATAEFQNLVSSRVGKMTDAEQAEHDKQVAASAEHCRIEFDKKEWGAALPECQYAADNNNGYAQYRLAQLYYKKGDPVMEKKALSLIDASAQSKYPPALYVQAKFRQTGTYLDKNEDLALELYDQSCTLRYYPACEALADWYRARGQDDKQRDYLEKAIAVGGIRSSYELGVLYEEGRGVAKDMKKADEYYTTAANLGVNRAQYYEAWKYYKGEGVPKDYREAYLWLVVSNSDNKDEDFNQGIDEKASLGSRSFIESVVSGDEKDEGQKRAKGKIEEIDKNLKEHREKFSFTDKSTLAIDLVAQDAAKSGPSLAVPVTPDSKTPDKKSQGQ